MGIATLMIVFFHMSANLEAIPFLYFLKQICDLGVDIFLILSGYGIYCSLNKRLKLGVFYNKRFLRIIPEYLCIGILWYALINLVMNHNGFISFFKDITLLSYWLDGTLSSWFVATILVFYIISPIVFELIKKQSIYIWIIICSCLVLGILIAVRYPKYTHLIFFISFSKLCHRYVLGEL